MSDAWIRRLVAAAIATPRDPRGGLLGRRRLRRGRGRALGPAGGGGVVLQRAHAQVGAGNTAWFLFPTLLFTALPIAAKVWSFLTVERSAWDAVLDLAPFLVGFAAPVLLLVGVYVSLRRRDP